MIICMMPTYGRRVELLNNSLACFMAQTEPDKHLVILDDLGTLSQCAAPSNVTILVGPRVPSLSEKYNVIIDNIPIPYDYLAIWDDDDVYLPNHLAQHVAALEIANWSKPSRIISTYLNPPREEDASGRFHGSIALRKGFARWPITSSGAFDQQFMASMPSPAKDTGLPLQYVYRWGSTNASHYSGIDGSAAYLHYRPQSTHPIFRLEPIFDKETTRLYRDAEAGVQYMPV